MFRERRWLDNCSGRVDQREREGGSESARQREREGERDGAPLLQLHDISLERLGGLLELGLKDLKERERGKSAREEQTKERET